MQFSTIQDYVTTDGALETRPTILTDLVSSTYARAVSFRAVEFLAPFTASDNSSSKREDKETFLSHQYNYKVLCNLLIHFPSPLPSPSPSYLK